MRMKRTVALLSTALVASMLLVTGCGRNAVNPLAPDESPGVEEPGEDPGYEDPGYEDPGYEPFPFEPEPGEPGGGAEPAPPAGGGGAAPAPAKPGGKALKPIARPTPVPADKGGGGAPGGADPEETRDGFMELLYRFGYPESISAFDVKMQLVPLMRVSQVRWYPDDPAKPQRGLHYGRRKADFPGGNIPFQAWLDDGARLAAQRDAVTFYVARGPLYREIIQNWYDKPQARELVFYKRLNRSNLMVSYRADGTVMDYGFFPQIDRRLFLEVPAAIWK